MKIEEIGWSRPVYLLYRKPVDYNLKNSNFNFFLKNRKLKNER
jgi:hypothetical protein